LCICYDKFVSFTKFLMLFCLTDENYIQIECLEEKLLTIKVWKIGQISCVHKPYFLMLGHKLFIYLLVGLDLEITENCFRPNEATAYFTAY